MEAEAAGRKGFWYSFARNPKGMTGLVLFGVIVLSVFLLPVFMDLDPSAVYFVTNKAPSADHILGLDTSFQDCFAKLVIGGRVSLMIGAGTSLLTLVIGIPLGLVAGFYQGKIGAAINRVSELFLSFPMMVLLLLLVAVFERVNAMIVVLAMGILSWPGTEKILYSTVLSVMNNEYVEAARAMGKRDINIMLTDVLPNSITPILVSLPFRVSMSIMMETSLAFLGLGVTTSWGRQIYLATTMNIMINQLWMWLPAAIALVVIIVAINCLGEGIRDSYDPKTARR
ncbi:MAG: ABC transporter permease [Oscillospiraceae bacterium]|jgi:peptide/nickel transport system permease protein|nr:ABC transporter permease [Oscillospiraceae bacterium]